MNNSFFGKLTDACHDLLLNNDNLINYLKARNVTDESIKTHNLGAFPRDLRQLYRKYDLDPVELREQNIVWNADQSQFKLYPIVIPIKNIQGNPIAIGCRTLLDDSERKKIGIPKYRNSSYKKTYHLFGLDSAFESIREKNNVFVVEGYFDAIMAHQSGVNNVVATCGTLFHMRQLMMLARYTDNICLLFDNDAPGRTSASKVIQKLDNIEGVNLSCKFTPDGFKDLDEFLRSGGDISLINEDKEAISSIRRK